MKTTDHKRKYVKISDWKYDDAVSFVQPDLETGEETHKCPWCNKGGMTREEMNEHKCGVD
jgi:hypothetical protein